MKKIFHYFVSFVAYTQSSYFLAMSGFDTNREITSFEDIQEIAKLIKEKHENEDTQIIILNCQLLRVEEKK